MSPWWRPLCTWKGPVSRGSGLRPVSRAFRSVSSERVLQCFEQQLVNSCADSHLIEVQHEKQSRFIPVKAYFMSTSIDLRGLLAQNALNVIPPNSRATNYVVLRYYDLRNTPQDPKIPNSGLDNEGSCSFMVVFQYGSVVLFNVADHEVDGYLKIVEKHASGMLPEMRKDDYAVVEKPTLETWMQGGLDYIMLKSLNIDGIRTIGSVLGQSIALDYYIRQVDGNACRVHIHQSWHGEDRYLHDEEKKAFSTGWKSKFKFS